jgi:hypothetical protein
MGWTFQGPGGWQLTVALFVLLVLAPAVPVMLVVPVVAVMVPLEPGLSVPADAAHDDSDAGEDDDHTYDGAGHQHWRHQQVTVFRTL